MQRMSVDLPDPDGPMTTTTSWRPTTRSMPRSAWKSPNHFSTPSHVIIGSPVPPATGGGVGRGRRARSRPGVRVSRSVIAPTPSRRSRRRLSPRHRVRARPVDEADEGEGDGAQALAHGSRPGWATRLGHVQQLEEPDDGEQRRVLEQADELADHRRDHGAQRLGQHDRAQVVCTGRRPEGLGRLELALGDRLQPAPHDLGDVGGLEQRDHDQRPDEEAGRIDRVGDRNSGIRYWPMNSKATRGTPGKLDVAHRHDAQRRQRRPAARAPASTPEREGEDDAGHGDEQRELQAAPVVPADAAPPATTTWSARTADGPRSTPDPPGQAGQAAPRPASRATTTADQARSASTRRQRTRAG